ncbi:MAG: Redoxin domain protein [Bryobacterales bacterium]|nr:Redoxin domain protein [Bryobacterales bacterium]
MKLMLVVLAGGLLLQAQGPVPRPAPELRIVEASGKTTMLSSYRGRVVLLAFISTQCAHCQRASLVFEQLSHEFAGRLQVAETAFDDAADTTAFTKRFGLTFPVGSTSSDAVHAFLGVAAGARVGTPQVVAIDRRGMIRAQSERLGSPLLQTPEYLRDLLNAIFRAEAGQ